MPIVLPTFQDLYDAARSEMVARNPELTDWNEGSNLDAVAGSAAMVGDLLVELIVRHFATTFFDTAEGEDLVALARDRYNLEKTPATPSKGHVLWHRSDPGLSYAVPAGTVVGGEVHGVRVEARSTEEVVVADDAVEIPCESVETGRAQNFAAGVLTEIVSSVAADPGATITQPERFAGGAPEQSDPEFRDTIRRYLRTVRRGTVPALAFGATQVPGVRYAAVDESHASADQGGFVTVYVGDPDAESNQELAEAVDTEMVNWRAAGVLVEIEGAAREEIALELELEVRRGAARDQIAPAVRAALQAYADTLQPNAELPLSRIDQVAHNAHRAVRGVRVLSHTEDITPSQPHHALRIVGADVALQFVEVI